MNEIEEDKYIMYDLFKPFLKREFIRGQPFSNDIALLRAGHIVWIHGHNAYYVNDIRNLMNGSPEQVRNIIRANIIHFFY